LVHRCSTLNCRMLSTAMTCSSSTAQPLIDKSGSCARHRPASSASRQSNTHSARHSHVLVEGGSTARYPCEPPANSGAIMDHPNRPLAKSLVPAPRSRTRRHAFVHDTSNAYVFRDPHSVNSRPVPSKSDYRTRTPDQEDSKNLQTPPIDPNSPLERALARFGSVQKEGIEQGAG
jgi:hypothetical protein